MALSWNEIKDRALKFSKEWADEHNEDAEAKTFLDQFFNVFGISRKRIGTFETRVKVIDGKDGYIDMLWKGQILIEMKSRGKNLDRAYKQATGYFEGLKEVDLPKYIMVCDFERVRLHDLEENTTEEFELKDFYKNVKLFGFIAGYQKKVYKDEDPVNMKAAELMGELHDELKAVGYSGHQLEIYLVRVLFCLFADDTSIFEKNIFQDFIENKTREDGSDTGSQLAQLFQVLNTDGHNRMSTLDEDLAAFPHVNGKLFEEPLQMASWNSKMRNTLLKCCALNWGAISPAIFGSMFQSVMDEKARRNLGAHYTSEKNILKLIKPLFLDGLWGEFEKVKNDKTKLTNFHKKIAGLRFLDPACGCGNFLIISYRELRVLELEVIKALQKGQQVLNIDQLVRVDVDQFYGIEYEEFPAQVAQVALWLMDHQMNMKVSEEFGEYFRRLPLKKSPTIVHGNALRIDWQSLLNPVNAINVYAENANIIKIEEPAVEYKTVNVYAKNIHVKKAGEPIANESTHCFNYILGNPPFVGYAWQRKEQKDDMALVFNGVKGAGVLDYVTCWYLLAAQYLKQYNTAGIYIKCAFVSTNSISQGEQVSILWNELFDEYHIKIHFAHRTFSWKNEARNNAGVHVVIIGFSNFEAEVKYLFEYDDVRGEPHVVKASNINPYLIDGKDILLTKRSNPISNVPEINRGSDAIDDGNLLLDESSMTDLIKKEPGTKKWIRPFLMAREYLHNTLRYCLWLKEITPSELKRFPLVIERIEKVKAFRAKSKRPQTSKMASFPYLFGEERQPLSDYLVIPKVSSENRLYIPVSYVQSNVICGDKLFNLPNATLYHLGVISSSMHMAWIRYTCGRLESRYSYSNTIVYNNFPWPENPGGKQKETVEKAARKVLDARAQFPDSSLADLYDPLSMPPALVKAHQDLDKAVDLCYRPQPFPNETKRIEFLFELYDRYTSGLFVAQKKSRKKKEAIKIKPDSPLI